MNRQRFNSYIKNKEFLELFIDMGWNNGSPSDNVYVKHDDETFPMKCIAQKSGFKVFVCEVKEIPLMTIVRDLDKRLRKSANDYILILASTTELMHHEWIVPVKSLEKRVLVPVEYTNENQLDFLFSKLDDLSFGLTERTSILDVTKRVSGAFVQNSEKVTKDFYAGFRKQHNIFSGFVSGIDLEKDKQWYVSVMLNRLMFCYFIQKKGFLNFDTNYLQNKLKECSRKKGQDTFYKGFYKSFLTVLFHDGLNNPKHEDRSFIEKFGHIPYLNGGLFDDHYVEREFSDIDIKDEAFENLFEFFDKYHWHLDTRIEASGKDINPDVIGYIFEQYINDRAQMGAYYTKEDITNYIGKNCILPFLWSKVGKAVDISGAWKFLQDSKDRYIYDSIKKGIFDENGNETEIPENIAVGLDVNAPNLLDRRKDWNTKTPEQYGLPTEIWRETIERRNRYFDIVAVIKRGEISSINDFITYNLDIIAFTQDYLQETDNWQFIGAFYNAMLELSVLDPTCGSGAFLFAAMNILEPLYDICIDRMEEFNRSNDVLFVKELGEVNGKYRSNRPYFIYKTIILRNLYGVDIMPEAIEIAKLRLFLKMVAVVEADRRAPNLGLDPLPDIDFNIRCGNTLVGFANEEELLADFHGDDYDIFASIEWEDKIRKEVSDVSVIYKTFRFLQLNQTTQLHEFKKEKEKLLKELKELNEVLNKYLYKKASPIKTYEKWLEETQPFHWFAEFYDIVTIKGGFDVIIGNPPYISMSEITYIKDAGDFSCSDLYGYVIKRVFSLLQQQGRHGFIVMHNLGFSRNFKDVRSLIKKRSNSVWFSFYSRIPAGLFSGDVRVRNCIYLTAPSENSCYSTRLHRWYTEKRPFLFEIIKYSSFHFSSVVPMLNNEKLQSIYETSAGQAISQFEDRNGEEIVYKKIAYNWLAISNNEPPAFDKCGKRIPQSMIGSIRIDSRFYAPILLLSSGKLMFSRWMTYGDDFHLSGKDFSIQRFPFANLSKEDLLILEKLKTQYVEKLPSTVQFKLNAGKRVGTYNTRRLWSITDQSDLVFLKYLADDPNELFQEIENHIASSVLTDIADEIGSQE